MNSGPDRLLATNSVEKDRAILEKLNLPNTIVVASGSAIKIELVRKALQKLFPSRSFTVEGVKAPSGINEQPIGSETEQGARSRLLKAQEIFTENHTDIETAYFSIESGLFEASPGEWEDRAVVVIGLPDGRTFSSISVGVHFPTDAVEEARQLEGGFAQHTVGSVIAKHFAEQGIEVDKQDPQTALTGGAMTREMQIMGAVEQALFTAAGESHS